MTEYKFTSVRLPARKLDNEGRCCGKKPIFYKGRRSHWCSRCGADFGVDGQQHSGNLWPSDGDGWFRAKYPDSDGVIKLLIRLEDQGRDNSQTKQCAVERFEP